MKSRTIRLLSAPVEQTNGTVDSTPETSGDLMTKPMQLVVPHVKDPVSGEDIHRDNNHPSPSDLSWDRFSRSCLSRDLFDTIGDKWAMLILLSIEDGPLRNGEIKDRVQGISPKMLNQRLGVLVEDGLVTRTSHHQMPPRVDYELTELGESVIGPVKGVYEWTINHMNQVMEFRDRAPKAS